MPSYSSQFPDPIALITAKSGDRVNVMTAGWTTPVSSNPPILMVSIAPQRYTHDLILESREFGLSILAEDQKHLSELAGTLSGTKVNKIGRPEFELIEADKIGAPLIAGARAWIECSLDSHHTVGDHTVFYGKVLKTTFDNTKSPLVLFFRKYYGLGEVKGLYP